MPQELEDDEDDYEDGDDGAQSEDLDDEEEEEAGPAGRVLHTNQLPNITLVADGKEEEIHHVHTASDCLYDYLYDYIYWSSAV